jgi:hypothetical protein
MGPKTASITATTTQGRKEISTSDEKRFVTASKRLDSRFGDLNIAIANLRETFSPVLRTDFDKDTEEEKEPDTASDFDGLVEKSLQRIQNAIDDVSSLIQRSAV